MSSTAAVPNAFYRLLQSKLKFRAFLFKHLPAAFLAGLRIQAVSPAGCTVTVPYKRLTQNPFGSTYFACLAMAAEMSTGVLVMAHVYGRKPAVSMLVLGMESRFHKKATGLSLFTCSDGPLIESAVNAAVETAEGQTVKTYSIGKDETGNTIAEFWITWTIKVKNK